MDTTKALKQLKKSVFNASTKGVLSHWDVYDMIDRLLERAGEDDEDDTISQYLFNSIKDDEEFIIYDEKNPHDFLEKVRSQNRVSYSEYIRMKSAKSGRGKVNFRDTHFPVSRETGKYEIEFDEHQQLKFNPTTTKVYQCEGKNYYSHI